MSTLDPRPASLRPLQPAVVALPEVSVPRATLTITTVGCACLVGIYVIPASALRLRSRHYDSLYARWGSNPHVPRTSPFEDDASTNFTTSAWSAVAYRSI